MAVGSKNSIAFYKNTDTSIAKNRPSWLFDSSFSAIINTSSLKPILIDLDNNGLVDLVYGYHYRRYKSAEYGVIKWSKNIGTAANPIWESAATSFDFNISPYRTRTTAMPAPALADLDNDGDYDLVVGGQNGTLLWYESIGFSASATAQAMFQLSSTLNSGIQSLDIGSFSSPALSDLDGDGDFDLAVGALEGSVKWFRNKGTISSPDWEPWSAFGDGVSTTGVTQSSAPAFADLDSDGDFDLVLGDLYGSLKWFRKNTKPYYSSGTYTSPVIDTGWSLTGSSISWTETVSSVTLNSIEVRSASLPDMSDAPPFGNCFVNSGDISSKSLCVKTYHRYVQFFDTLKTTDNRATPKLDSVQLNFSSTNPYFSYSEETGYENGVNPVFGATTDNFTYKIVYYDSTTPTGLAVNLTIDDVTTYPMTLDSLAPAAHRDGDFSNGEQFIYSPVTFPTELELHNFKFTATSSNRPDSFFPEFGLNTGPWVVDSATAGLFYSSDDGFENDNISPDVGYVNNTEFSYKVIYAHPLNIAPNSVRVFINGSAHSMSLDTKASYFLRDGDVTNGEQYLYTHNFLTDSIETVKDYSFSALFDSPELNTKLPSDGSLLTGPQVLVGPPKISMTTPNQGMRGKTYPLTIYGKNFSGDITIEFISPGEYSGEGILADHPVLLTQLDPLTLTRTHPAFDICKTGDSANNSCYELKTNITIDALIYDDIIDAGPWDLKVTNNFDGRSDTKVLAFKIIKEMGAISGIKDLSVCTKSADCPGSPLVSDCPLSNSVCDITLIWTSPPSAATYDPRYSQTAINPDGTNWNLATQAPGSPFMAYSSPPLVIKLTNNKVWSIGVMSSDLVFKSSMSNVITVMIGDLDPPDAVTDLTAIVPLDATGEDTINLSWKAVNDPPVGTVIEKYEIRFTKTKPLTSGGLLDFITNKVRLCEERTTI